MQNLTASLARVAKTKHLQTTPKEQCDMLSKQRSELQLRVSQAVDRLSAELLPVLTLYYPVFASQFCGENQDIDAVMAQFAERMITENVTLKGFRAGIEALKKRAGSTAFALNPQAFAELCNAATNQAAGIPSLMDCMDEIIRRRGVERHNQAFQFSHQLTRLINERKGAMIYQLTSIEFEKAIKSEYDHWTKRIASGEQLPEVQACLSDQSGPDLPDYLKNPAPITCRLAKLALRNAQGEVNAC